MKYEPATGEVLTESRDMPTGNRLPRQHDLM
jgi:hypothetical protein